MLAVRLDSTKKLGHFQQKGKTSCAVKIGLAFYALVGNLTSQFVRLLPSLKDILRVECLVR